MVHKRRMHCFILVTCVLHCFLFVCQGSMCLLQQVQKRSGPVVSICMAYIRDGKLLNCSLLSPDRIVPDIYTLNQGIGGSPVDVYICLKKLHLAQDTNDPKAFMMENYKEKNEIMMEWDRRMSAGTASGDAWMSQFSRIESNYLEGMLYQIGHAALIIATALFFRRTDTLLWVFCSLYCLVAGCHTIGFVLNSGSTSTESVPFETGIKSILLFLQCKEGSDKKGRARADI